jgi:hypothetical protein
MTNLSLNQSEPMPRCEEVREILLEILSVGLLRIRVAGWSGKSEQCANEADHLHNVPETIRECSVRSLSRYYDLGRTGYLDHPSKTARPQIFEPLWNRLRLILNEVDSSTQR